jgi:3-hydroxymyristoyl/3-hydroxydecanoyl-(acyl carrier protein) dehydratase
MERDIDRLAREFQCILVGVDSARFRRPVVPGDQLRMEVDVVQNRGATVRLAGKAYVDGQLVAEAVMMARVVDR